MRTSLLLPAFFMGLAGCAAQAPPDMTSTTYNPATTTTTTYASPAVGAPYAPTSTSTTYATPVQGYMAPTGTSTTYVTRGQATWGLVAPRRWFARNSRSTTCTDYGGRPLKPTTTGAPVVVPWAGT